MGDDAQSHATPRLNTRPIKGVGGLSIGEIRRVLSSPFVSCASRKVAAKGPDESRPEAMSLPGPTARCIPITALERPICRERGRACSAFARPELFDDFVKVSDPPRITER